MLAKLGLDEGALQCGIPLPSDEDEMGKVLAGQRAPSPLQCDCSGKHTGMLASCLMRGFPTDTYLDPKHPLQVEIRALVAEACGVAPRRSRFGHRWLQFTDVWRVVGGLRAVLRSPGAAKHARQRAQSAARGNDRVSRECLREGRAGRRSDADRWRPDCRQVRRRGPHLHWICLPRRLGIAIRIADGSFRSHPVVVASVLRQLGVISETEADAITRRR